MAVSNPPLRALLALCVGVSFAGLIALPDATARASFDSPYTLEQTYNTTLRFIRIDRAYKVTEKDPSAAYVLFEYKDTGNRVSPGAVELVASQQTIKVVVQLPQMPKYHEQALADGLAKKLREEYGEPPRKAPPPADAGASDAQPD